MAKFCPLVGHKVVYLDCIECDERVCVKSHPSENSAFPNEIEAKPNEDARIRMREQIGEHPV